MHKVQSSNIAAIGFEPIVSEAIVDGERKPALGDLTVEFRNGRTYRYIDVPESTYAILLEEAGVASRSDGEGSVGKLFARLVRNAGFDFEEVES